MIPSIGIFPRSDTERKRTQPRGFTCFSCHILHTARYILGFCPIELHSMG